MELTSAVGANAITGLGTWVADNLYERYRKGKLNKDRLGPWHEKIFKRSVIERVCLDNQIHIFKVPSYSELEQAREQNLNETPLGAVCWRGLLSKYVKEDTAVKLLSGTSRFVQKDQVGAFKGNVAALANVADIYKVIFSNLDPARWKDVTLNKAERVATKIGDFSMLYYDNAKWFHFVPTYNGISAGRHGTQLKNLLDRGHTIDSLDMVGLKEKITVNDGLVGCWTMRETEGEWSRAFQSIIFEHMLFVAGDEGKGVFYGGVTTKSKEYEVSRLLANVIHMALVSTVGGFVAGPLDLNNFEVMVSEKAGMQNRGMQGEFATFESAFLAGGSITEVLEMASAASNIVVEILRCQMQRKQLDNARIMTKALLLAKALKVLRTNLTVLNWNVDDLETLNQEAWLAGVDDTVVGESSGSSENNGTSDENSDENGEQDWSN